MLVTVEGTGYLAGDISADLGGADVIAGRRTADLHGAAGAGGSLEFVPAHRR